MAGECTIWRDHYSSFTCVWCVRVFSHKNRHWVRTRTSKCTFFFIMPFLVCEQHISMYVLSKKPARERPWLAWHGMFQRRRRQVIPKNKNNNAASLRELQVFPSVNLSLFSGNRTIYERMLELRRVLFFVSYFKYNESLPFMLPSLHKIFYAD